MKFKVFAVIALLAAAPFMVSGEGRRESAIPAGEKLEITDTTGNTVVMDGLPERITFAGRASIMVADALYMFPQAPERIVGVGFTNQGKGNFTAVLDSGYKDKTYLDYSAGVEQIAGTHPDLVIMKNYMRRKLGDPVSELGIPVLYLSLETPSQYEADFKVLGKVFGDEKRADYIISWYKKRLDAVTEKTEILSKRPSVLFLYHSARDGEVAFNVPPREWIQTSMVRMAGGDPVWSDSVSGKGWIKVNFEQIAAWNPDYIFIAAYKQNEKAVVKSLISSPRWKQLEAVKNGRVSAFPVDFYSWDQPDSRWILGVSWLAKTMHPGLFSGLSIEKITKDFYKDLYLMSDETYNREIKTRLGWK